VQQHPGRPGPIDRRRRHHRYTREDPTDGTRHWDLILDTAGRRTLSQLRRALAPRGTLVIVGGEGAGRWLGGFDRNLWALVL
jgi:NADPH:quinone reductase-like Zn-dependent oxidoreductase